MAIESNVNDVIADLEGMAADVADVQSDSARVAARGLKEAIVTTAGASGVHGLRLRGVGKGGRLEVRVTDEHGGAASVSGEGPWPLVEGDTRAHSLRPRRGRRVLRTPYGPRASWGRAEFKVRGTRGKHIWQRALERGSDDIVGVYQDGIDQAAARRFNG